MRRAFLMLAAVLALGVRAQGSGGRQACTIDEMNQASAPCSTASPDLARFGLERTDVILNVDGDTSEHRNDRHFLLEKLAAGKRVVVLRGKRLIILPAARKKPGRTK